MGIISLALANVEKNALSQQKVSLSEDTHQIQSIKQGQLSDALLRGEITEEVKLLRHRTYKVLEATSRIKAVFSVDENGNTVYKLIDTTKVPSKIKGDPFDTYPIKLIVNNLEIMPGWSEMESTDNVELNSYNTIQCSRKIKPKFKLEKYAKKLFVRTIDDENYLLEFYVSKYPDEDDRKTVFLLSELKKIIENTKYSDILDISNVGFITFNAIGSADFKEFVYEVNKFDKIVEYDGFYIVKFKATPIINGDNVIDKYNHEGQEELYRTKAKRKNNTL